MQNKVLLKLKSDSFMNFTNKDILYLKRKYLDKNNYHLIIKNFETDKKKIKKKIIKFSKLFGTPISQNKLGKKYLIIKPNVKLLKKKLFNKNVKLRYHQTNLGGAIHSDGPQLSTPPKYVIMGCIKQAEKGGYSVITSVIKIYNYIKKKNPRVLKILKKNFFFERRGFNYTANNIFKKPIFKNIKKKFCFRYLREYIESAYEIKKKKLKTKEIYAFNLLDKLLRKKEFQNKYKLNEGDLIILNNFYLAHGRSSFKLNSGQQRSLIRIWIK